MTLTNRQSHELTVLSKEIAELQENARVIGLRINWLLRDDDEIEALTPDEIHALSNDELEGKRRDFVTAKTRIGIFKEIRKRKEGEGKT